MCRVWEHELIYKFYSLMNVDLDIDKTNWSGSGHSTGIHVQKLSGTYENPDRMLISQPTLKKDFFVCRDAWVQLEKGVHHMEQRQRCHSLFIGPEICHIEEFFHWTLHILNIRTIGTQDRFPFESIPSGGPKQSGVQAVWALFKASFTSRAWWRFWWKFVPKWEFESNRDTWIKADLFFL